MEAFLTAEQGDDEIQPPWSSFLKKFILTNQDSTSEIVLITSGGTSVALEKFQVRSLENFSTGQRGANLAQAYLKKGTPVVFFTRDRAARPFEETNSFREKYARSFAPLETLDGCIRCQSIQGNLQNMSTLMEKLLVIEYVTVVEYISGFRRILNLLQPVENKLVVYAAAAVSDFYVPNRLKSTHKISGNQALMLELHPVPVQLRSFRLCVPKAFFIHFKLETDDKILIERAKASLFNHCSDLVIANLLQTRYTEVTLVSKDSCIIVRNQSQENIETEIVEFIESNFLKLR